MSNLDASEIQERLTGLAVSRLDKLEVFASIASTNTHLLAQAAPPAGRYCVAVADFQTAGRGRHDRHWISAPGAGLCLSFSYTFGQMPAQLPALTLAIGVGVIAALHELGVVGVSLKWPNDIVALDGKLGGILTEAKSAGGGQATVVTGIGINLHNPAQLNSGAESDWAQRPVDLHSLQEEIPARELLAGTVIDRLYSTFSKFEDSGFAAFAADWRQYDWLRDREITVDMPDGQLTGIAAGVGDDGALLVDNEHGRTRVISGSIVLAGPVGPRQ